MEKNHDHIRTIVAKSAQGDHKCFRELYDHLIDGVFAYLAARTDTREQATDLAQDVFIDLHRALPAFTHQTDEQFYAFVFTIVRRKLAKFYGDRHVQFSKAAESYEEGRVAAPGDDHDTRDAVTRALNHLDDVSREIVVLYHWSRYTFPEIASLLDMTESAVRVRHHRAQKKLAGILNLAP